MYRVADSVRSTHGQDGAVMLDVQQGQMFTLNIVGSRILELLATGSPETEIVTRISREFNTGRHMVESDLREFIDSLKQHGLIEER
jgi:Coenzyme PQQ synthesis protein D (PqqD)